MNMYYNDHSKDQALRVAVFILFTLFAFCWTFFFQGLLFGKMYDAAISMVGGIEGHYSRLVSAVILTLAVDVIALCIRMIPFVKGPFYSLDFLASSIVLGLLSSFDGELFFTRTSDQWITVAAVSLLLLILAAFIRSRFTSRTCTGPAKTAINLMILPVLFMLTAILGNTDELYHRELLVGEYLERGNCEKALLVGKNEEESSVRLDVLRTNAMMAVNGDSTGFELGDRLFDYSIYDPVYLSSYIRNKAISDSACHDNAMLVAALLDRDLERVDSTINVRNYNKVMPRFIMQAMVITGNENVRQAFPQQFRQESENYRQFLKTLEESPDRSAKYLKNRSLPDWRNTYFRYYRFK